MRSIHSRLLIATLAMLALSILPLPTVLSAYRPAWVLLLALYVQCFMPQYFNLSILMLVGLCLDVLLATVMGEHAFALLLVTWMFNNKSRRLQFFTMGQQMALIGLLVFIYQLTIVGIDAFLGYHYSYWLPFNCALISFLFWPWLKLLADDTLRVGAMVH